MITPNALWGNLKGLFNIFVRSGGVSKRAHSSAKQSGGPDHQFWTYTPRERCTEAGFISDTLHQRTHIGMDFDLEELVNVEQTCVCSSVGACSSGCANDVIYVDFTKTATRMVSRTAASMA